jgi:leucine dehydrogenase
MPFDLGHEQVVFCQDPAAGYRGIIAVHSTKLGPAVGGTRLWNYATTEDALTDALRLSRGMTYKNAAAGLALGGGKSVIIADSRNTDREALFLAHARAVDRFQGRYITAEDVGTSVADMEIMARVTRHVAGLAGRGGDPSPWTARGVLRGMQASAFRRWGRDDLAGKTVAVQGCGNVGHRLARLLKEAGARLIVTDADAERAAACARECEAEVVALDDIYDAAADIFAPCALGAVLNDETIPRLRAEIVAGAANNQLAEDRHGAALEARGILYAPDFIINAGGVICGGVALQGEDESGTAQRVDGIFETLQTVYELAESLQITTAAAAERFAEQRLQKAT